MTIGNGNTAVESAGAALAEPLFRQSQLLPGRRASLVRAALALPGALALASGCAVLVTFHVVLSMPGSIVQENLAIQAFPWQPIRRPSRFMQGSRPLQVAQKSRQPAMARHYMLPVTAGVKSNENPEGKDEGVMGTWNYAQGYSYITPNDAGEQIWCPYPSLIDGEGSVKRDDVVLYWKEYDEKRKKWVAKECKVKPPRSILGLGGYWGGDFNQDEKKDEPKEVQAPSSGQNDFWGEPSGTANEPAAGADDGVEEGLMKRWNYDKGFGFITPDSGGEDLFCHVSGLVDGDGSVNEGDKVSFIREWDDRKGKYRSTEVRSLGASAPGDGGEPQSSEPVEGYVKLWNGEKGFGFIESADGGGDVFCHVSRLVEGDGSVQQGDTVSFIKQYDNRKGKWQASDVRLVNRPVVTADGGDDFDPGQE